MPDLIWQNRRREVKGVRKEEDDCRDRRPRRSIYDRPELLGLLAALFVTAFAIAAVILNA